MTKGRPVVVCLKLHLRGGRSTTSAVRRTGCFSEDEMAEGDSFSFRFDKPGTYRYQCTFHHLNVKGVVMVEEK